MKIRFISKFSFNWCANSIQPLFRLHVTFNFKIPNLDSENQACQITNKPNATNRGIMWRKKLGGGRSCLIQWTWREIRDRTDSCIKARSINYWFFQTNCCLISIWWHHILLTDIWLKVIWSLENGQKCKIYGLHWNQNTVM